VDHQREQVRLSDGIPSEIHGLSKIRVRSYFENKTRLESRFSVAVLELTHYLPAIPRIRTRAAQYSTRKYRTDHSHIVALPLARIADWMRPCKPIQPMPV